MEDALWYELILAGRESGSIEFERPAGSLEPMDALQAEHELPIAVFLFDGYQLADHFRSQNLAYLFAIGISLL